jgi:hypothetical protein
LLRRPARCTTSSVRYTIHASRFKLVDIYDWKTIKEIAKF